MIPEAESFLDLYREDLDKLQAFKESGLSARMLRKLTEPRFVEYDKVFTEAYLEIEEGFRATMVQVAVGVALSNSRQRLSAAKFATGISDKEVDRVEQAHIRWLENAARERKLAERQSGELDGGEGGGPRTIEEMKRGGGAFGRTGTGG